MKLLLTPQGWATGGTWTPQDVEQETLDGYFRQWQGDNELLNEQLAHWRYLRRRMEAWRRNPSTPYPYYIPSELRYVQKAPE